MCLLSDIREAGVEYTIRETNSDLYIPVTDQTKLLIKKHQALATVFTCQISGNLWYDVFGGNTDYWKAKENKTYWNK